MATFVHDADMLLVQAKIAREAANVLRKKQKEIHKKQQQTKSKNLQRRIEEYNSSLMDIREAVNRMEDILSDGGFNSMTKARKNELSSSLSELNRERDKPKTRGKMQSTCFEECMKCLNKDYKIKVLEDRLKSFEGKEKGNEFFDLNERERPSKANRSSTRNEPRNRHKRSEDQLSVANKECIKCHNKDTRKPLVQSINGHREQRASFYHVTSGQNIQYRSTLSPAAPTKTAGIKDNFETLKHIDKAYDEPHQKYQDERDQRTKYQRWYKEEQEGKEDALRRFSSFASSELRDNNPNIPDPSDQFRPTKLAEKMSDLYDNQWTEAYNVLEEQGLGEKEIIKSLLDMFMTTYAECSKLANENCVERVQRCIEKPTEGIQPTNNMVVMPDQLKQRIIEFRNTRAPDLIREIEMIVRKRIQIENEHLDALCVYLSHCIEIAWLCVVQDPPLVARTDAPVKFDSTTYKVYTKQGRYTEFVVWPALYLHDGGALLSKGVAQGSDTTAPDSEASTASGGISSVGLSCIASSKLRDNNPNIADLSNQFRPTKIAEKMSELYDNQWTDAYSTLEDKGLGEKEIIKSLLDMFMASFKECSKLASENFFERVQRCIEIPTEGKHPTNYKVVMPDQLKQQVKEFRKTRVRFVIKEIETIVRKRIQIENQDLNDISVYLSQCIEVAWFCAVQDPPLVVRRDAPVKFDSNTYKDYTRRGKYTEFVVWPALYLHDGGALLSKGVAQGSDTTAPDSEASSASGGVSSAGHQSKNLYSSNSEAASKAKHVTDFIAVSV